MSPMREMNSSADERRASLQPFKRSSVISQCGLLAIALAEERHSRYLSISDLLGALYLGSYENIRDYWPDQDRLSELVSEVCGLTGPLWLDRIKIYDSKLRGRSSVRGAFKDCDPDLAAVLLTAAEIAKGNAKVRPPTVNYEHILLAIARHRELEISKKLVASGIDLNRLNAHVEKSQLGAKE